MTATPVYPQTLRNGVVQIVPADASTLKTVFTPGASGSKLDHVLITSTDTSARDIQFYLTISAVDYLLGTISIPANSGFTNSVSIVSLLDHTRMTGMLTDVNGNKFVILAAGSVLKAKMLTTITAAKVVNVITQGGDF